MATNIAATQAEYVAQAWKRAATQPDFHGSAAHADLLAVHNALTKNDACMAAALQVKLNN